MEQLGEVELLDLILKIARTETKAERGSVFLADQQHRELWSIVASGLDHQEIRIPFGRGVAGRVAEVGGIINVEDAYSLDFFDQSFDAKFGYRTKSLLCLPIRHHNGEIVGVVELLNQSTEGHFTLEHEEFLTSLTGHMAVALENARLHREALEKQRMERDLAVARGIQRSLLPDAPPIVPGYDIAVVSDISNEVSGDYYDFLNLGPHTMLLVTAEVQGRGVNAALVMAHLHAALRALVMHLHSLEVLTLSLNEMIFNDIRTQRFLSVFLGLVDISRGGLYYINAGHIPPALISGSTGEYRFLQEGGPVIGLMPGAEYRRGNTKLENGDVLVCCTDGVPKASNGKEEFGSRKLAQVAAQNRHKNAHGIAEAVLNEVNTFCAGGPPADDRILIVVKSLGDTQLKSIEANPQSV